MDFAFDDRNLLHPGVHDASMEDVEAAFGRFQRSDRRVKLFAKLTKFVEELKRSIPDCHVIVDGSFVMKGIDEPGDVDIVLVMPVGWDMKADVKPYQYNLVSKRVVRKTFGFDLFVVESGSQDESRWIDFFGQVEPKWSKKFGWPKDLRKGIVRIMP